MPNQQHSCRSKTIPAEAGAFLPKQEHSCRSKSILAEARAFLPKQNHSCRSKSILAEAGAFLPKQEHSCRSRSILAEARAFLPKHEPIQCHSSKLQYLQALGVESHNVESDGAQQNVTWPRCSILTGMHPIDQPAELTQHKNVTKHLPCD